MPNDLISVDMIVAQNFFLEIDSAVVTMLSSVSGLDVEVDVVSQTQAGKDGKSQIIKSRGTATKPPDISLVRMAPADAMADPMWKWFRDVIDKGFSVGDRVGNRKNGSIVMYDSANTEVARFNFYNGWPSKISTDQLSVDSNDAVKETITLVCERLERVK